MNNNNNNNNKSYIGKIIALLLIFSVVLNVFNVYIKVNLQKDNEIPSYDIVIVGGGLAGLSTSYYLNNYSVLILEKENKLGGRVNTIYINGTPIDLGGMTGISLITLPFELENPNIYTENGPFGIYYSGEVKYNDSVLEVVDNLNLTQDEKDQISDFGNYILTIEEVNETVYDLLNSIFNVINSGEVRDFIPSYQHILFARYYLDHYLNGTSILVDGFKKRINATISLESTVTSVEDEGDKVRIYYQKDGQTRSVYANACVVTTPGPITKWLVKEQCNETKEFLDSLKFGAITSVPFIVPHNSTDNFSYIITHDSPFNVILKFSTLTGNDVIMVYYMNKSAYDLYNLSDTEVTSLTIEEFNKIGIGNLTSANISYSTVHRWKYAAPIISNESYGIPDWNKVRPSDRVFLAGDYSCVNSTMSYGMNAAIGSGKRVAKDVKDYFNL